MKITTNTVVVESGGDLIFTAPSIELGAGFEGFDRRNVFR
jgi:hypothetical protein